MLEKLDRAVELGDKYGMHLSTDFHRGPGYSVNREFTEPHNFWKDAEALKAFSLPVADAGAGEWDVFSTYATAGGHGIPKRLVEVHGRWPATLDQKNMYALELRKRSHLLHNHSATGNKPIAWRSTGSTFV